MSQSFEHAVSTDTLVVADLQGGAVNKGNARWGIQVACLQIDKQGNDRTGLERDKPVITDQPRKVRLMMFKNVPIVVFERSVAAGLKGNQDRHDLTDT